MKISTEQIVALQETIARRKDQAKTGEFESLLHETLDTRQAQGVAPIGTQGLQNNPLSSLKNLEQVLGVENVGAEISPELASKLEAILGDFEAYAATIGKSGTPDLRLAHAQLETMSQGLSILQESFPEMQEQDPELAGMFNELAVLATTERFKFNRGDYL